MRPKINTQSQLNFQPSDLPITQQYYAKYQAISDLLEENPAIVDLIHADLADALEASAGQSKRGGEFRCTSDTILRILLSQIIEGLSLRQVIVRIDDSNYLRWFVRIFNDRMIDFSTFCGLKNRIKPQTWKQVNALLASAAVEAEWIDGKRLRLDTTAVETNIHWPSDSSLLWDCYRTLGRIIDEVREIYPWAVGNRRLLTRKAKRLYQKIARIASRSAAAQEKLKRLYTRLIRLVEGILEWSADVCAALLPSLGREASGPPAQDARSLFVEQIHHYGELAGQVVAQTRRRVIQDEQVPNEEKIFSIFEPHSELLIRGKAGKRMEFGHMIQIEQVDGKFISDYDVFAKKPDETRLLEPAIERHRQLFGHYPDTLTADKGYYQSMDQIERLGREIAVVGVAKKGRRSEAQTERESDPAFRHAQRFRAGIEGTISFLKRILGLARCYNKGWEHYAATVGATILAHNLLILARC